MTKHFNPSIVEQIKEHLWHGEFIEAIAESYNCSESLIGNIASGHRWGNIPWPDGSLGALPATQSKFISAARKQARPDYSRAIVALVKKASKERR